MKRSILGKVMLLAVALIVSAAIMGCGGDGSTGIATPPAITDTAATVPADFAFDGGSVSVTAKVSGSSAITNVRADVTRPDGSTDPTPVTMTAGAGGIYTGTYTAVANTREDGVSEDYTLVVTATDNGGRSSTSAEFHFHVPAPVSPVIPPPL